MESRESFELSRSSASDLINLIKDDIYELHKNGIYENRIMISIPQFLRLFLEHCLKEFYMFQGRNLFEIAFGKVQIIPGYNNQICVFDVNASPHQPGLKPINIKFYG